MTFIWPSMLFTLLLIPMVVAGYILIQRRRRVLSANFRGLGSMQPARGGPGLRRHAPALLFLLGLTAMLVALARPQAQITLPRVEGTVMLVFDVSASMGATDVEPSRLEAAKTAAREFALRQPPTVQIGVVSFSGSGFTVQAPTNDANKLLATINRLKPTRGTSLGQGIAAALKAIAVDAGLMKDEPAAGTPTPSPADQEGQPAGIQDDPLAQLPAGPYPAAVIVLLTDGENNQSIDPVEAAEAAAERGVRVDALGFGTAEGVTLEVDGYNVHTALDEAALQEITGAANGAYYLNPGEGDRAAVYGKLTPQLVVKPEAMEITAVCAGVSLALLLAGSLFSMFWFNRLP